MTLQPKESRLIVGIGVTGEELNKIYFFPYTYTGANAKYDTRTPN